MTLFQANHQSIGRRVVISTAAGKGRKPNTLLNNLAKKVVASDGKDAWVCKAPNCDYTRKGYLQAERVLPHSTACTLLEESDPKLFDAACKEYRKGSVGAQLEVVAEGAPSSESIASTSSGGMSMHVTNAGELRRAPLVEAGKKTKVERDKRFQAEVDHIIMRLVCVRGLVPNVLDSPEWKELMAKLNGSYKPTSADDFRGRIIPREAAFVREKQIRLLKNEDNLTLTFDGTTIRKQESFYSAHATTALRKSYFLDAHEGSGEHHNTDWIKTRLLKV